MPWNGANAAASARKSTTNTRRKKQQTRHFTKDEPSIPEARDRRISNQQAATPAGNFPVSGAAEVTPHPTLDG